MDNNHRLGYCRCGARAWAPLASGRLVVVASPAPTNLDLDYNIRQEHDVFARAEPSPSPSTLAFWVHVRCSICHHTETQRARRHGFGLQRIPWPCRRRVAIHNHRPGSMVCPDPSVAGFVTCASCIYGRHVLVRRC